MNTYSHVVPCFSAYPSIKATYVRDDDKDREIKRFISAVKNGKEFRRGTGEWVNPCWLVAIKQAHKCVELTPDVVVVPVPRSTVTPADPSDKDWPGLRLAKALTMFGTSKAKEMRIALRRRTEVQKASTAKTSSDRPTVQQHIDSLAADLKGLRDAQHVVLVDDVLTRGAQMMGAACALWREGFTGTIRGFAAGHTEYQLRRFAYRSIVSWDGASDYPDHSSEQPMLLSEIYRTRALHRDN